MTPGAIAGGGRQTARASVSVSLAFALACSPTALVRAVKAARTPTPGVEPDLCASHLVLLAGHWVAGAEAR